MSTTQTGPPPTPGTDEESDAQKRLPPESPPGLRKAADGEKEITPDEEAGALDFLLGETVALEYDVKVDFETPSGMQKLIFHMKQVDGARIEEIENEFRDGTGPFSKLDNSRNNSALVTEATVFITDETGRQINPKDREFRGAIPDPREAMRKRFSKQPGLLDGLAAEVQKKAGYSQDRVGKAERILTQSVGNS